MLLPLLTVLCAPRPLLPHARPLRLPQFASVPTNLAGCDASIHGAFLVHQGAPFHHVECVGGVLLVDGVWVSSGQLGVTRALSFYHAPSDAYVVVAEFPPVGTATNVPVAGRTGTIYLRANNFTRLYATSLPPQLYDITEVATGKFWYTFEVQAVLGAVGIEAHYALLENTGYSLANATEVFASPRSINTYNITFNRNWPDSGNGEYIAADLYTVDGPVVFNQYIRGVAYKYNATICACFWNGTACANFCEANSTSFGFRGDAIDVKGQLRKSVYVPAVGSPPPLTPAQLKQLRDVDSVGAALVLAGEIDSRPSYVVGVCDAKAALTAVRGITSISPGNVFSNDFWGMGCGTEVGSGAPAWQRLAHEYLTKSMTWWMANNNLDICDSSKPDTCSFCNVSSAEAAQCLKSPDGKPSPASNTSVFDLFKQQGQVRIPTCDSCGHEPSCLVDCLPNEIADAILHGPFARNISEYLTDLAYGTLSLDYLSVPKGSEFNDWMYHTWNGDRKDTSVKGEHSGRLDRIQTFFQLGMPTMKGYNALGEVVTRYSLKISLAGHLKEAGVIPMALRGNACFAKTTGHFGVALLDAPNTTQFAEAPYSFATSPDFQQENLQQLALHCQLRNRVNHMLDMLAPDNPEFVLKLGNKIAALSLSKYADGVQLQDPGDLADYVLEYLHTHFFLMYECRDPSNAMPACKDFRDMDAAIRYELFSEYNQTMVEWGIQLTQLSTDALLFQVTEKINIFSAAIGGGGTALSNIYRALDDTFTVDQQSICRAIF